MSLLDNPLWSCFFYPASLLYGAATGLRAWAYRRGYLETVRLPVPVFCLGNVTVGGTGKTPGVIALLEYLLKKGRRPAVITRGYGRRSKARLIVVGDGEGGAADPLDAGDEPRLIARRFPEVPVVAGVDRAEAGRWALERFRPDCLVMDDGFQHYRLYRDLDLVCVDAAHLAGQWGNVLLPAGPFRERLSALSRAGVVFLTKAEMLSAAALEAVRSRVRRRAGNAVVTAVRYGLRFFDASTGAPVPRERFKGIRVLALTGLARPESFEDALRRLGARVDADRHADHHHFRRDELAEALERASANGMTIVVTEKDLERLPHGFPCWVGRLDWTPEDAAWTEKVDSVFA